MSEINIKFNLTGDASGIESVNKGLRTLQNELIKVGKDFADTTKKGISEFFVKTSQEIGKTIKTMSGFGSAASAVAKDLDKIQAAEEKMAKMGKLASDMFTALVPAVRNGEMSLATAEKEALKYAHAMEVLKKDTVLAVNVMTGFANTEMAATSAMASLNKEVSAQEALLLKEKGALEITGKGFKFLNDEAYKLFVTDKDVADGLKKLQGGLLGTEKTVNLLSVEYKKLLESSTPLGDKSNYLITLFKVFGGDAKQLKIELGQLNREFIIQTTSAEKMANKIKDCGIKYAELLASSSKEGVAANKLTQEFVNGQKTIGEYTQGLSKLDRAFTKQLSAQDAITKNTVLLRRAYQDLLQSNTSGAKAADAFFKKYESGKIPLGIFKKELQDINKVYVATLTEEKKREVSLNHLLDLYNKVLSGNSRQSAEMWKLLSAYEATGKGLDSLKIRLKELSSEWTKETTVAQKVAAGINELKLKYDELAQRSAKATLLLNSGPKTIEELRLISVELQKLKTQYKDFDVASASVKKLSEQYIELVSSQGKYGQDARALLVVLQQNSKAYDVVKERLSLYTKELRAAETEAIRTNEVFSSLKNTYATVSTSTTTMGNSARIAWRQFHDGTISIKQLEAALKLADKSLRDYGRQQQILIDSTSRLDRMIGKLTNSMASYARYMISSSILQGLQSAFSGVTDEIINHDQALHDLQAITQSTDSEILTLNKTLIEVANSTKYTMSEIAEGMKQMAQAGYNTQEIAGGIESIANLATGAAESLSTAINLVTSTMATFNMGMEDSAKVADMFANAVTSSRLTISGLNTTMSYIGPAAVNANIPLKDLMATLEMLSQAGMRASTQGTGMTELLSKLANPTEKFKTAVQNAGYALEDFDTQTNDWRSVMEKMITLFDGSGEAIEMFGTRAARVALALKTQGVSAFDEFSRGLERTGTANQMAEKSMEGLATMVIRLKTNLTILGTEILHSAVEPLRTLLGLLLDGVAAMKSFAETGLGKVISATTVWVAALASLALAVKVFTLVAGFKGSLLVLATQLILTGNATLALQMSMDKLALSSVTLTTRIKGLALALRGLMFTPTGIAITVVTAIIGVAIASWYAWKKAIEDTIQANNEYSVGLKSVRTEIDAYNKAVAEHGRESDEAKKVLETLNKVIEDTGKQTKSTKELMDQFSDVLKSTAGDANETSDVVEGLGGIIDNELRKKLDESTEAMIRLREKAAGIDWLIEKFKALGNIMLWYPKMIYEYWNFLGKSFKETGDLITDLWNHINGIKPDPINDVSEAFKALQKAAEDGSQEAKKALEVFSADADNAVNSYGKLNNIIGLTEAEITQLAQAMTSNKPFDPVLIGAYASALKKLQEEQEKTAKTAEETALKEAKLSSVIKQVNTDITGMQAIPTDKAEKYIGDLTELQKQFDNWRIQELDKMSGNVAEAVAKEKEVLVAAEVLTTAQIDSELQTRITNLQSASDKEIAIIEKSRSDSLASVGNNEEERVRINEKADQQINEITTRYEAEKNKIRAQFALAAGIAQEDYAKKAEELERDAVLAQIDILNQKKSIFIQANADRIADLEEHAQAHKALYEEMYAEEKSLLEQNLAAQNEALKGTDQTENQILIKKSQNQREYYQKLLDLEKKALGEAEKLEQGRAESYSQITEQMTEEGTLHFSNVSLAQKQAAEEAMKIHSGVSEDGIKHFWHSAEEEKKAINESSKVMQEKFKDQETLIKASVASKKKEGETDVELAKKAKSEMYKLGKEQLKDQISNLKERQAKYKEVIEGLKALEASLTDAIIAEKKKIKDIDKDLVDIAREMRQSAMSEEKIHAEEENRLNQLVAKQQQAYLRGEGELVDEIKDKIIELAKEQMNRANADKESLETGEKIVLTESQKAANVEKYLAFVQKASLTSQEMSKKTVDGLENEKEAAQAKAKEVEEGLKKTEDILKKVMNDYIKFTSVSLESLEDLNDQMDELIKKNMSKPVTDFNTKAKESKTHVDTIVSSTNNAERAASALADQAKRLADEMARAAQESAKIKPPSSSGETKLATGGSIPGYGGGDIVPAVLEPGEWVIRKEAVKQVGQSFMRRLNAGLVQPFATGGMVSTKNVSTTQIIENNPVINNFSTNIMDKLKDFGTVKLNFGNNTIPVIAHQNVIAELSRHMRRESLMGAN